MTLIRSIAAFLILSQMAGAAQSQTPDEKSGKTGSSRNQICLNGIWDFMPIAELANQKQSGDWGKIWVPGAWTQDAWWTSCPGIEQKGKSPIWATDLSSINKAWYAKKITIPANWKGKAILLDFGRISTDAQIFINSRKIGIVNWPGGEVDITPWVVPGKTHEFKVLVLASSNKNEVLELMGTANAQISLKPSKLSSKGITGEVFLKCRPSKTYISDVFVQTSVRNKEFTLNVEFSGINRAEKVKLTASLENEQGKVEKRFEGTLFADSSQLQIKTIKWKWDTPRLWDLDQPKLYTLKLKAESSQIQDEYIQEFGFREFWIEGKDFYLNNKKINLRPTSNTPGGGNYTLTDAAIIGLRKAGYNFFEIWPQNIDERGMLQFNDIFMDRADRKGVLISAPLPPSVPYIMNTKWEFQWNEPGQKDVWETRMERELRRIRNHPSVVMWGINPNFFGHSDDQNPQVIGQRGWIKEDPGWQTNAQAAEETIETIRKYDPTRPVFNHHGAYTGDVHTLNFYLCLTPLQERIEWLSHYSQFGNMPFMAIEFGTPLENTMLRGRCPFGESIITEPFFTEYAAVYLGKEAYTKETKGYKEEIKKQFVSGQKYKSWQFNGATNKLPSFQTLESLFNRETWRAYRTWGISGGMVPWSDAHGWRRKPKAGELVNMPAFQEGQRGAYYKQVSRGDLYYFDSAYWEILPSAKSLMESNGETLAWIGGSPERFTALNHHFKAGENIEKQVILINDSRNNLSYRYNAMVVAENKPIQTFSGNGTIGYAEIIRKNLIFKIPDSISRQKVDGKIILEAVIGGKEHRDTFEFRAFKPSDTEKKKLICYDPCGKTSRMLQLLGYEVLDWAGDFTVQNVIIGREVLSGNYTLPADLKAYVSRGGHLMVMAQKPEWFEAVGFRVAKHMPRHIFKVSSNHPVLDGLDDRDFSNWNGKSTLVEEYPDYLNRKVKEGMYGVPYYGWHWGNYGALSSAAIEKPHQSGWRPILECEFDLAYSPLMEMSFGKGSVILCTLDLEDFYQTDVVAQKVTNQLIHYFETKQVNPRLKKVQYVGDKDNERLLSQMGLLFEKTQQIDSSTNLLIVGDGVSDRSNEIHHFLSNGGQVLFLPGKSGEQIEDVRFKAEKEFSGSLQIPDWEQTAGLSFSDLHFRSTIDYPVIEKGCEMAANGLLGRKVIGKGLAIFCQLNPRSLLADSLTYFRQTRWRQTRALSQILSNMGASFESDEMIFRLPKPDEGIRLEGEWKAKLIEKMPVTLSVVGGNEDKGISEQANSYIGFNADEQSMQVVRIPQEMERFGQEWTDANGEAVFRKSIDIPVEFAGNDLELDLGVIDDFDETFFNGHLIGKVDKSFEEYWGCERKYRIPANLVKPGKNVIAVRVFDRYGSGGLLGSEKPMVLRIFQQPTGPGFYHADYRSDFKLGDDPYRYFRW